MNSVAITMILHFFFVVANTSLTNMSMDCLKHTIFWLYLPGQEIRQIILFDYAHSQTCLDPHPNCCINSLWHLPDLFWIKKKKTESFYVPIIQLTCARDFRRQEDEPSSTWIPFVHKHRVRERGRRVSPICRPLDHRYCSAQRSYSCILHLLFWAFRFVPFIHAKHKHRVFVLNGRIKACEWWFTHYKMFTHSHTHTPYGAILCMYRRLCTIVIHDANAFGCSQA